MTPVTLHFGAVCRWDLDKTAAGQCQLGVCAAVATLVHAGGWLELGWDAWNFGFHLTDQVHDL
jgi:hypothetical protein